MVKDGEDIVLHVDDQDLSVHLKTHARARRLSLRADPINGRIVLVRPRRVSKAAAIAFAIEKADWIAESLAELLPPVPFADGAPVPVQGIPHIIQHAPDARRGVWQDNERLNVSGSLDHLPRRVRDWFREEARKTLTPMAHDMARSIDRTVSHVSVRDTRSRWGSCSADGRLSFSWRLLMAPPYVLRYVAAHEIAHLRELNHSKRFWQTVESLTDERQAATRWLKQDGAELYRYGLNV